MGKFVKVILIIFSVLLVLIIAAIVIIPMVVDLNDYKPEIEAAVKDKTGRTLSIEGDLDISVFPWLGISTGKISLSNAQGFTEKNFALIGESDIKVKLIPLLSKKIEVRTIVLKGLELNLAKNKQGLTNWHDLTPSEEDPAAKDASNENTDESAFDMSSLALGGLVLENSHISWNDQQAEQHVIVNDFNLGAGAIAFNEKIGIENFKLSSGSISFNESLVIKDLALNSGAITAAGENVNVESFNLSSGSIVSGEGITVNTLALKSGAIAVAGKNINVESFNLSSGSIVSDEGIAINTLDVKSTAIAIAGEDINAENFNLSSTSVVSNKGIVIKDIALDSGAIAFDKPVDLKVSFFLENAEPAVTEKLTLSTQLVIDKTFKKIQLTHFKLDSVTKGESIPGGVFDAQLLSDISLDLQKQTLALKNLQLNTNTIDLTGDIKASQLDADLQYTGAIQVAEFNPKTLLQQLQMDVPETADKQVLQKLVIGFNLQGTTDSVALKQLKIALDNTQILGSVSVKQFKDPAIGFNLNIDHIDVDQYIAPTPKPEIIQQEPATTPVETVTTLMPVDTLRALNLSGDLSIGKLKVAELKMAGVKLNVQAKQGILKTRHSIKQLYQGHYQGQISINAKSKIPTLSLNEKIDKVQIEPLLKALSPDKPAKMKGTANVAANLNMRGNTIAAFKSSLAGNLNFSLLKGVVYGFNLQQYIDVGRLAFKGKTMKQNYANEQTVFSVIKGSANIKKGLVNNPDFLAESSDADIKGSGTINLVNDALKYKVLVTMKKNLNNDKIDLAGRSVELNVAGTIQDPTYSTNLLSMISEKEKQKVDKLIGKGEKAIDKALGEGSGKAVNDLLKSFF